MREIKFRAWEKKNRIMSIIGELLWLVGGIKAAGPGHYINNDEGFVDGDNIVLMQYTGLKDKNGKEIYEGDILGWGDEEYRENICVVEISLDGFRKIEEAFCYSGRVIGNIYENTELLK